MIKFNLLIAILFASVSVCAQEASFIEESLELNKFTEGILTRPTGQEAQSLIIFIQGSGPTDKDGNQPMMKNDGMKKISRQLAERNIASFRYDKRIFKMNQLNLKEQDLSFKDLVMDVEDIITYFRNTGEFESIILAGHSQGSLVAILAAKDNADALISLAGAAEPIDSIIVDQIYKQAPPLAELAKESFNEMREMGTTSNYSPMLENIFRKNVQPYMYSWMQYNPSEEIKKLDIPVLIVNGTADIQVEKEQAEMLKEASPQAKLVILEGMNHIFRKVESEDRLVNTKTYNEPNLPLHPELIPAITLFIKDLE